MNVRRVARHLICLLALGASANLAAGAEPGRSAYQLRVNLAQTSPQIDGVVHIRFTNTGNRPLEEAVLMRFPERFALPDIGVDDFNRPFIYPYLDFDPGRMDVVDVRDDTRAAQWEVVRAPTVPDGVLMRVRIARLLPGASRTLTVRFRTVVPERFGPFGRFENQLTLAGGWYPYLPRLDADGTWRIDEPPPLADFDLHMRVPRGLEVVVNGQEFARGRDVVATPISAVPFVSVIATPEWERHEMTVGATRVVLLQRPLRRVQRISIQPKPSEAILEMVRDLLERSPHPQQRPDTLLIVSAPLRYQLSASGEGMVLLSDRALKVHRELHPFHGLQLAQAVYTELLRPRNEIEPNSDWVWVRDGLARALARRWAHQRNPEAWSVYDWIDLLNVFAIVDRFESEPRIPFVSSFFERARVADPLRADVTTYNDVKPPGRVVFAKLDALLGDERFEAVVDQCVEDPRPFRACAGPTAQQDLEPFFTQWLQPYPALNYSVSEASFNEPVIGGYRHRVGVHRDASRPIFEPVPLRLRGLGGEPVDVLWHGTGDDGEVSVETPDRMYQATIDPDRELIEDRRDDNAAPFAPQVVLDSAEVEVSSTEFGISGLFVARNRYDYRKDIAVVPFYTNRSAGFTVGPRWHGGNAIDSTRYEHNVYLFYAFQALDNDFSEDGGVDTPGNLGSLGARYDYTNVYAFDNPTQQRSLRVFVDWYDTGLGGDYSYMDWGLILTATQPLWSYRSIAAMQVLNGFSHPFSNDGVPNQGQFSLGGSRSIRGVGAEDELGRNILLMRLELRQEIFPELDWNMLDFLVVRRHQLRMFVDSGRVENSAGRIYDISGFAVGVGVGVGVVYDFLGFFPSLAYFEVATRVDRGDKIDDVQFLFGSRQAF